MSITYSSPNYSVTAGTTSTPVDLKGLGGTVSLEMGTGDRSNNNYDIGTQNINVYGTFNVDPFTQHIHSNDTGDAGLIVRSGGVLNINGEFTYNGKTVYSTRRWFTHSSLETYTQSGLYVLNGGELNWNGGEAFISKGIEFEADSVVRITDAIIDSHGVDNSGNLTTGEQQIRQSSNNLFIDGLTLHRGFFTIIAIPKQFDNYKPRHCYQALAFSSSTPDVNIPLFGYDSDGSNTRDGSMWRGNQPILIDPVAGVRLFIGGNATGGSQAYGFYRVIRRSEHTVIDSAGAPVDECFIVRMRDTDGGLRGTYAQERFSANNYDGTPDFSYIEKTDTQGQASVNFVPYLNIANTGQSHTSTAANIGVYQPDYRFDQAVDFSITDPFNDPITPSIGVTYWALGKASGTASVVMEGSGIAKSGTTLFNDLAYTATNKAEIDAYTTATAEALYNATHGWLYDQLDTINNNTAKVTIDDTGYDTAPVMNATADSIRALLETLGDIGTLFASRNETNYNTGGYNIIFDDTATRFIDYDGTNVTIKADEYHEGLTNTGTIALPSNIDNATLQSNNATAQSANALTGVTANKLTIESTSGDLTYTDCNLTELVINTGNDHLLYKSGGAINVTETNGRVFATVENGAIDCQSYDVVYDTSASEYASISGNVITINDNTNTIKTNGTVTANNQLDVGVDGIFQTSTPIDIADGVTINHLKITSGTHDVDIQNINITTLENATGAQLTRLGNADTYIGDWTIATLLTINVSEDNTILYVIDNADNSELLSTTTNTSVTVNVGAATSVNITANGTGKFAVTKTVSINGDTQFPVTLSDIPNYKSTANLLPFETNVVGDQIQMVFSEDLHASHEDFVYSIDQVSHTVGAMQYLCINGVSERDIFEITATAFKPVANFYIMIDGNYRCFFETFFTPSTYNYRPENEHRQRAEHQLKGEAVTNSSAIEQIVFNNNPNIVNDINSSDISNDVALARDHAKAANNQTKQG